LHQRRAEGSDPLLWAEGVPGAKMQRMISVQYGNSVLSQWIERFKKDRTSVKHGEGTGRQSTSINDADMECVYGMILQNRQVTVDEEAHQLQISRGSAYESIHNRHAFHKVCV
jgi:transposase